LAVGATPDQVKDSPLVVIFTVVQVKASPHILTVRQRISINVATFMLAIAAQATSISTASLLSQTVSYG
jgi:hypothetical protein